MRRMLAPLFIVCTCAAPAVAQRNLVANPGFEDGLDGWRFWGGAAPGEILVESEDVHSGAGALRVTNPSAGKVRAFQPSVRLNQDEPRALHLRYWVKRMSTDPEALQCVDLYGRHVDGSGVGFFQNTGVEHAGEWVLVEQTFEPEKPVAYLGVWALNYDTTADVLFDDIEFWVEPPPRLPTTDLVSLQTDDLSLRFVSAGNLVQVRGLRGARGRTYLDGPEGLRPDVNLWELRVRNAEGETLRVLPDDRALLGAEVREGERGAMAVLSWRGVYVGNRPAVDVDVFVLAPPGQSLAWFTCRVDLRDERLGLVELQFPVLAEMPPLGDRPADERIVYPQGLGRELRDPHSNPTALSLSYPSSRASMQMMAWYDGRGGLYFAAHDGEGYLKTLLLGPETTAGLRYSVAHLPPDTGRPGLDYQTPYPVVVGPFEGDWYDAGRLYRAWATRQTWCSCGRLAERGLPAPVRETSVWMVGHMPRDRSGGARQPSLSPDEKRALSPEELQEAYLPLSPELNREAAARFQDYFDVPVTWWWTTWMLPAFDTRQGCQVPPRRFAESVAAVTDLGIPVIPYTNIRRFDVGIAEWEQLGLEAGAVIGPDGEVALEPLAGGYTAIMCPASETWQRYFARYCLGFIQRGVTGLYIDELGTATARPCYSTDHGHRPGAGKHWVQGRRAMLRRIRELCEPEEPDFFTGGEEPCEPYIDLNDYNFTYGSRRPDQVPLWQAVYHDYSVSVGRPMGKWYDTASMVRHYPERLQRGDVGMDEFVTGHGQALVFGIQPGWVRPDIPTYAPETSEYYRRLVRTYHHAKPWLLYGEMLPPPRILTDLPVVASVWRYKEPLPVELPAVLASAWRAPDGTVGIVLANISQEDQGLELVLPIGRYRSLVGLGPMSVERLLDEGAWQSAGEAMVGRPIAVEVAAEGFAVLRLKPE